MPPLLLRLTERVEATTEATQKYTKSVWRGLDLFVVAIAIIHTAAPLPVLGRSAACAPGRRAPEEAGCSPWVAEVGS